MGVEKTASGIQILRVTFECILKTFSEHISNLIMRVTGEIEFYTQTFAL